MLRGRDERALRAGCHALRGQKAGGGPEGPPPRVLLPYL